MDMPFQGAVGLVLIIACAWVISENRGAIDWRTPIVGLLLQFGLALLFLWVPVLGQALVALNEAVLALQEATKAGTSFVFGYLGGGDAPFPTEDPAGTFVLAFQALPLILVTSALSALLYHWRILPWIVQGFGWLLVRSMRIGGAAAVATSANIFVGMIEAPLYIRPYLARLSRGEMFMVMTTGMATIAGTMLALYAATVSAVIPGALGHIVMASLISAPAAVMIAAIMVPATGEPTPGTLEPGMLETYGSMHAIAKGTADGVYMLLHVIAMLLVLVALVRLVDIMLGATGYDISLVYLLGYPFRALAWVIGVPWIETQAAGELLATKVVINEFVAYIRLASVDPMALSERSALILTYAMCGFANFGSLGIMIGGISSLVPERRAEITELGLRSIVSGMLATAMTGAVVGLIT